MGLYELLQDRAAVNVAKLMYLQERLERTYACSLENIRAQSPFPVGRETVQLLVAEGVIAADYAQGTVLLTLTAKGKRFVETFDHLVALFRPAQKASAVRMEYTLTPIEWQVLLILQKIQRETGEESIPLKAVRDELYPHQATSISLYVKKLLQLNLLERQQRGREVWLTFTPQGKRMIQEKLMGFI